MTHLFIVTQSCTLFSVYHLHKWSKTPPPLVLNFSHFFWELSFLINPQSHQRSFVSNLMYPQHKIINGVILMESWAMLNSHSHPFSKDYQTYLQRGDIQMKDRGRSVGGICMSVLLSLLPRLGRLRWQTERHHLTTPCPHTSSLTAPDWTKEIRLCGTDQQRCYSELQNCCFFVYSLNDCSVTFPYLLVFACHIHCHISCTTP